MKSAYELAMERLERESPDEGRPLTDEQRAALAEITQKYQAKTAEREIFLNKKLEEARGAGQHEDAEQVQRQLASERVRLEEEMEAAKDRVRRGEGG